MRDRLIQLIALLVLFAGVISAYLVTPSINRQRVDLQLTYDTEAGDDSNPLYTMLSSLGSFRGIAVNILWQRAESLKNEGKFYEANILAEMITSLQPRYPQAWDFQGWNMAYNISVKCVTAEERWDWVQKGMALFRDRGIPNNPNSVVLYRSLAWILGHKMTGQTDDMHWYYKAQFAEEWQIILGKPARRLRFRPEYDTPETRLAREDIDPDVHLTWVETQRMQDIADMANAYLRRPDRPDDDYNASNYFATLSPATLERFYADHPLTREIVLELEQVVGPDGQELDLGMNVRTLRAFGRLQMYESAGYSLASPSVNSPQTLGIDAMSVFRWSSEREGADRINLNPNINIEQVQADLQQTNPDARVIDLAPMLDLLRAQALIADYHMDPAFMAWCMEHYGPMDWRHPAAHSCYWTALGTLRAEHWELDQERVDFLNANRATIHALQHLSHYGTITFRPEVAGVNDYDRFSINDSPDTRMIPAYDRAWTEAIEKLESGAFGDDVSTTSLSNGHENFLQSAVYLYYFEGQDQLAREYYDRVKSLYDTPENMSSPARREGHYSLSLPDFARVRLADDLGFQNEALIMNMIRMAWTHGLAERDPGVMGRYLNAAKQAHDSYIEGLDTAQRDPNAPGRQGIPIDFDELVVLGLTNLMTSGDYSIMQKRDIWILAAPLLNSQSTAEKPLVFQAYLEMIPIIAQQAEVEGYEQEVISAFPRPAGFDEWYQQNFSQAPLQ